MADRLAVGQFHHTAVVVNDIQAAMRGNSIYFGIPTWHLRRFEGRRLPGFEDSGFISAMSADSAVAIELLQPLTSEAPHAPFRSWRGEGMSHAVSRCSDTELMQLRDQLGERHIAVAHELQLDGHITSLQLDTRTELSGVAIEVQVEAATGFDHLPVDQTLHFEFEPLLPVDKLYHVGVVVNNREQAMQQFCDLLGLPEFLPLELAVGESLSSVIFRGERVHHEARVAFSRGHGFCFEVMQPGAGQGAYQEFQNYYGEGMQHYFPTICDQQVLDQALPRLSEHGVDVRLLGVIDGVMNYYYLATEKLLGGYIIEVICPHQQNWMEVMGMTEEQGYLIGL